MLKRPRLRLYSDFTTPAVTQSLPPQRPATVAPTAGCRPRLLLALVVAVAVWLPVAATAPAAWAQDAEAEFGEPAAPAPANDPAPAADPEPGGGVGDNGGGVGDNGAGGGGAQVDQSVLSWALEALTWPYVVVFLALSITLVSLFVMNVLAARRETLCPQELIDDFGARLSENDNQGAYDLAKNDESVLGQVLAAGLAKVSKGYNKAIEAMQEVGEEESMKLEHRLSYMALIGNLAPMIGLFGTVQGMISSFQVIAVGGSTPRPSDLAQGISTALFTTLVGLAVAIPAIAAYNILRNRVARLLLEVGVESENLMSRFEDVAPKRRTTS